MPSADLILRDGRIATMNSRAPFASAIAIRDGRIATVGEEGEVVRLQGAGTQVADLKGRTVVPGLNDSHLHLFNGANGYNQEVRWDGAFSLADGLRMMRETISLATSSGSRPWGAASPSGSRPWNPC